MARLLRSSCFNRTLFASQVYRQGPLMPSSQTCNFSTKGKKKSKSNGNDSGDENLSKKDLALQQALDQIIASFGKGAIMWLGRSHCPREVPVISTGSFSLDLALGIGGLPKGRVVEIYGQEASGKTTLALHVIAESQKAGGYCAFVDAEHALDPVLAETIGVKTDNLLLSQPDSGEQALSLVDTLIRSGSIDVVVVDSVAALVPKSELDGDMGDAHMALQARLMSQALRKLSHSLSLSQTILIFINQVRNKLSTFGGFGGPTEVTSGGNALKFYASVRLNIKRVGFVKKGEERERENFLRARHRWAVQVFGGSGSANEWGNPDGVYCAPSGGYSCGGVIRPSVVCSERRSSHKIQLTCPAKRFTSYIRSGKGYGGGGCTIDCKKMCEDVRSLLLIVEEAGAYGSHDTCDQKKESAKETGLISIQLHGAGTEEEGSRTSHPRLRAPVLLIPRCEKLVMLGGFKQDLLPENHDEVHNVADGGEKLGNEDVDSNENEEIGNKVNKLDDSANPLTITKILKYVLYYVSVTEMYGRFL